MDMLKSQEERIQQRLTMLLDENTLKKVFDFTEKARLAQHKKSKTRQQRKFDLLVVRRKPRQNTESVLSDQKRQGCDTEDVDKWVKNLSDRQLTETEKNILAQGLNFAVTPGQIPLVELITATETAIRNNNIAEMEA